MLPGLRPAEGFLMLRLTITGDRFQVAAACDARDIPHALKREDATGATCDVDVPDGFADVCRAWQREPPNAPPYPVGACLCVHTFPARGILGSRGP